MRRGPRSTSKVTTKPEHFVWNRTYEVVRLTIEGSDGSALRVGWAVPILFDGPRRAIPKLSNPPIRPTLQVTRHASAKLYGIGWNKLRFWLSDIWRRVSPLRIDHQPIPGSIFRVLRDVGMEEPLLLEIKEKSETGKANSPRRCERRSARREFGSSRA